MMSNRTSVLGAAAILMSVASLAGEWVMPELRRVPVSRLVANFERRLAENPKDVGTLVNLARLHGMAYALKTEEAESAHWGERESRVPWYGFQPNLIPYEVKRASSPDADRRAKEHLSAAIRHYERALALDPKSLLARLGYAWMLDQAAKKDDAIREYRRVISDAWPLERTGKRQSGMMDPFFTAEASRYLLRLLDPVADAREIADVNSKLNAVDQFGRAITPIAIPLRDDVPESGIADPTAHVFFDADGSGLKRRWTWISRDAGWLVYDADGSGEITSALQWFGNVTFWLFWENGYEALASLDDDANGELTGAELRRLAIWDDANANGRSERGEVRPLLDYGIVALSCVSMAGDVARFAAVSRRGVRFADGRTRPTYDAILRRAPETTF